MRFERLHITVFLGLTVLVWWLVLKTQGTAVTWSHAAPFSAVVGFLVIFSSIFERWLWRWSWLHDWFVRVPDLRGTWRVQLQSSWVNPESKEGIPPIICYMGVEQTLSTLQMHLMTPESESWFIAHRIRPAYSGRGFEVIGVYTNKPSIDLRAGRSKMHQGALVLQTHGDSVRPITLKGEYWTDRPTTGTMDFTERRDDVTTRFEDAERLFE